MLTHIHITGVCKEVVIEGCQRVVVLLQGVTDKVVVSGSDQVRVSCAGNVCKNVLLRSSPRTIFHSVDEDTSLCVESRSSPGSGFIVAPAAVLKVHGLAEPSARAILECPQGSQIILPDNALKEILRGEGVDSASERQLKQREQEQTGARLREETARAAEAAKAEAARREAEELRREQQEQREQQEVRVQEQRRQQQEHRQQQAAERAAAAEAAKREREQQERERAAAALAAVLKQQQERELKQQLEREAVAAAKAAEERRRDELEIARAKEENRKREEEKKARAAADAAAAAAVLPTAAGLAAAKASPVTLTFTLEEDFDALCRQVRHRSSVSLTACVSYVLGIPSDLLGSGCQQRVGAGAVAGGHRPRPRDMPAC
jgi:hypothetical protein